MTLCIRMSIYRLYSPITETIITEGAVGILATR